MAPISGAASGRVAVLKKGGPTEIFSFEHQVGEHRVERADQHHGGDRAEQQVVQHQRALARQRREDAGRASAPAARQANSSKPPPMKMPSRPRMKTPRSGSLAKACTLFSTPERTRKVPSRLHRRRRAAPGRRSRSSAPPASPPRSRSAAGRSRPARAGARRSPPGPRTSSRPSPARNRPTRSPARCRAVRKRPGRQRPGPHPAAPGGIHAALDQGGDGEGEGDGEADIAGVEQRRVEGEAGVLQHRVHAPGRRPAAARPGRRGWRSPG